MRASRLLGYGLGVILGSGSVAIAQFAVDRSPTPLPSRTAQRPANPAINGTGFQPSTPSGFQPAAGSYPTATPQTRVIPASGTMDVPPAASSAALAPAPLDINVPLELTNHPLALKPEHGPYVICVKSYSRPAWIQDGPKALHLAEELANEIRTLHRAPAFLLEHVSEEKKAEMARRAVAIRERQPFLQAMEDQRKRAELNGSTFLGIENGDRIRYKTVRYNDQFAVVIAGYNTDKEARKALDTIRKWPLPKNKMLMDSSDIAKPGANGKTSVEQTYLSPYGQAFVAPNPTVPKTTPAATSGLDDFTIRLNEGRPYNLLKVKQNWTLAVKQFSAPTTIQGKDQEPSLMRRSNGADVLNAGAEMAEQTARWLREMRDSQGQPKGVEAFVLHTRTGSLVTVGRYDSPDDPLLHQTRRMLMNMNFMTSEKANQPGRPVDAQSKLFSDNILPIPVPR